MKKKRIVYGFLILLLAINLVACKEQIPEGRAIYSEEELKNMATQGGEIRIGLKKTDDINPLLVRDDQILSFSKFVFNGLLKFDDQFNIVGDLAESYSIEDDGRKISLELKDGIYWHDGEPLEAEDIKNIVYKIKEMVANNQVDPIDQAIRSSYSPRDLWRIMDIETEGKNISFYFDKAFSNSLEVLSFPLVKLDDKGEFTDIGAGPYKLVEKSDQEIILKKWEKYNLSNIYLDKIRGIMYTSLGDSIEALNKGELDLLVLEDPKALKSIKNKDLDLVEFTSSKYEGLVFNMESNYFKGEKGRSMRNAIGYSIDRLEILKKAYDSYGKIVDSPIHPDSWLAGENEIGYFYDLNMAKDLYLEEGAKLRLVTNTYSKERLASAKQIKKDLKKLGIEVEIVKLIEDKEGSMEEGLEALRGKLESGEFDLALLGWDMSILPDYSFLYHSSQIKYGTNLARMKSQEIDDILFKCFAAKDREEKKEAYNLLHTSLIDELPYFSILYRDNIALLSKGFKGNYKPNFNNIYKGVERLFLEESKE